MDQLLHATAIPLRIMTKEKLKETQFPSLAELYVEELTARLQEIAASFQSIAEGNAKPYRSIDIAAEGLKERHVMLLGDKGVLGSGKVDSDFSSVNQRLYNLSPRSTPTEDQPTDQPGTGLQIVKDFSDREKVTPDEAVLKERIATIKDFERRRAKGRSLIATEDVGISTWRLPAMVSTEVPSRNDGESDFFSPTQNTCTPSLQCTPTKDLKLDDQEKGTPDGARLNETMATLEQLRSIEEPILKRLETRIQILKKLHGQEKGTPDGARLKEKMETLEPLRSIEEPILKLLETRLQILKKLYDQEKNTPDEARLKDVVAAMNLRNQSISEANVKLSRLIDIEDGGISKIRKVMIGDRVVAVKFRRPRRPRSEART